MVVFFRPKPPKVDVDPNAHEGALGTSNVDVQTGAVVDEKKTKKERYYVARLDAVLLIYCCLASIIKGLDQQSKLRPSYGRVTGVERLQIFRPHMSLD